MSIDKSNIRLVETYRDLTDISSDARKFGEDDDFIGVLGIKGNNADYCLYSMDDFTNEVVEDVKLKDTQFIFRFDTEKHRFAKSKPLIKIDLKTEMVYFLDAENEDDDKVVFENKGIKIRYLSALVKNFVK